MLEKYISELIDRMIANEFISSTDESISFLAHREAERLTDTAIYPLLKNLLTSHTKARDKRYRNAAYFIMGKVLKNSPENEYLIFYLNQLEKESDKYILSAMLDRISDIEIPQGISIEIIIPFTTSVQWLIRHSAIKALGSSDSSESKTALAYYINQEDEKTYKYEMIYANTAFGRVGTEEDIPLLEQHINSRIRDVRDSAKFAINSIKDRLKSVQTSK
jgi:HEAT repeat protein